MKDFPVAMLGRVLQSPNITIEIHGFFLNMTSKHGGFVHVYLSACWRGHLITTYLSHEKVMFDSNLISFEKFFPDWYIFSWLNFVDGCAENTFPIIGFSQQGRFRKKVIQWYHWVIKGILP